MGGAGRPGDSSSNSSVPGPAAKHDKDDDGNETEMIVSTRGATPMDRGDRGIPPPPPRFPLLVLLPSHRRPEGPISPQQPSGRGESYLVEPMAARWWLFGSYPPTPGRRWRWRWRSRSALPTPHCPTPIPAPPVPSAKPPQSPPRLPPTTNGSSADQPIDQMHACPTATPRRKTIIIQRPLLANTCPVQTAPGGPRLPQGCAHS